MSVIPYAYGDMAAATAEAERLGVLVAAPRRAGGQLSLSPASLVRLEPGARVLLPSPNGSRLSLATGGVPTIAGCLRNATAVARAAASMAGEGVIAVIAAGERWPDQTLRPAVEDWLGAGAIIAALAAEPDTEAELAATTFRAMGDRLADIIRDSRSGRELTGWGHGADVDMALQLDATATVPVLQDGAYLTH